jgi:dTDP-4-amino-4,6-dideoxygalactose transaminase
LALLRRIPGLSLIEDHIGTGVWPVMLVLLPDRAARDAILDELWGSGYGLSLPFVHTLPDYAYLRDQVPAAGPAELPQARRLADRLLAIGNSPWVEHQDREMVCAVLRRHAAASVVTSAATPAASEQAPA